MPFVKVCAHFYFFNDSTFVGFVGAAWPIFLFNLEWPVKFMKSRTVADNSRVVCGLSVVPGEWVD